MSASGKKEDRQSIDIPVVQFSDLLPGDVLLYRPQEPDALQKRVSAATNSPYTHAAIHLGHNLIAESVIPFGVTRNPLDHSLSGNLYIGVLRTQQGFGSDRQAKLDEFVTAVVEQAIPFHRHALVNFGSKSKAFFDGQLAYVAANYGQFATSDKLAAQGYFCSGFIVACYQAVGIIDNSAQVAFPPEYFSPAHLYDDATFGWLLGFVVPEGGTVPEDDPLMMKATLWRDIKGKPWWE